MSLLFGWRAGAANVSPIFRVSFHCVHRTSVPSFLFLLQGSGLPFGTANRKYLTSPTGWETGALHFGFSYGSSFFSARLRYAAPSDFLSQDSFSTSPWSPRTLLIPGLLFLFFEIRPPFVLLNVKFLTPPPFTRLSHFVFRYLDPEPQFSFPASLLLK